MTGHLSLWTVCRFPEDYPDKYTARRAEIHSGGTTVMTGEVFVGDTLGEVRQRMRNLGLVCLTRHPEDDPVIVEVWL
jgi:hypothetical protein